MREFSRWAPACAVICCVLLGCEQNPGSGDGSSVLGVWKNDKGTVTITPFSNDLYRIVTETSERKIDGLGHLKANELIAVRWYVTDVIAANQDRHVFGAYILDDPDTLRAQSYEPDGSPAYTNVFTRVQ